MTPTRGLFLNLITNFFYLPSFFEQFLVGRFLLFFIGVYPILPESFP